MYLVCREIAMRHSIGVFLFVAVVTAVAATAQEQSSENPGDAASRTGPTIKDCAELYDRYTRAQIKSGEDAPTDEKKAKAVDRCLKRSRASKDKISTAAPPAVASSPNSNMASVSVSAECDPNGELYLQKLQSSPDPTAFANYCAGQVTAVDSDATKKSGPRTRGMFRLTPEEADILKRFVQTDTMMLELEASNKGFAKLSEQLAKWAGTAAGPLDIVFKLTDADIEAAQKAIKYMDKNVADPANCNLLLEPTIESTPNASLFEKFRLQVLHCPQ